MNRLSTFASNLGNRVRGRTQSSALSFQDAYPATGAPPVPALPSGTTGFARLKDDKDAPVANQVFPRPLNLRRNKAERERLQGLMANRGSSASDASALVLDQQAPVFNSKMEQIRHWFINEGGRRTFVAVWLLLHALVFALGFCKQGRTRRCENEDPILSHGVLGHYYLKDNQETARATFGITYPIARASALVLHVDVAMLLIPVCRNLITLIRRTPLNSLIPFDAK